MDGTRKLIAAAEDIKKKQPNFKGILFTTWSGFVVPQLRAALLREGDPERIDITIRGIANVMRYAAPKFGGRALPLDEEKLADRHWDGYLTCWETDRVKDPVEKEKMRKAKLYRQGLMHVP